ncbi:MgtC/SapB family protein [Wenxinia saemankumensis]|uniref:Protein MgtC n=1 Tax=Wenxinia saemankumensis TaxID=1447782 RepID=A0A1M6CLS3_9RHOB|nr:MgtC/SapB family protein [Wenxinia saemankumensis]SHI61658.1 putative Mg2+ transporter-C (MgtC) family protein [Wenxinia saemankumensis]
MLDTLAGELTGTFTAVPLVVSLTRLIAAVTLGALIGFERERKEKPAGLRTHMLVSLAACLFVLTGLEIARLEFGDAGEDAVRVDPLRLIEAVTAGVAFLAAGLIFTQKGEVRNVTTGASLWLAGAIGLACGAGHVPLAAMSAVLVVCVLFLIGQMERRTGTHRADD